MKKFNLLYIAAFLILTLVSILLIFNPNSNTNFQKSKYSTEFKEQDTDNLLTETNDNQVNEDEISISPIANITPTYTPINLPNTQQNTKISTPVPTFTPQPKCSAEDINAIENGINLANGYMQDLINQSEQSFITCKSDYSDQRTNAMSVCTNSGMSQEGVLNCINSAQNTYNTGITHCESIHNNFTGSYEYVSRTKSINELKSLLESCK